MEELYIINRTDFQEDLLDDVALLEGDITLLLYGNIKKLMKAQKDVLEEASDNIKQIDKFHCTERDVRQVLNYIKQNYSEYSLADAEHPIILLGSTTQKELADALTKTGNKKNHASANSKAPKRKKQASSYCIDCSTKTTDTSENEQNKATDEGQSEDDTSKTTDNIKDDKKDEPTVQNEDEPDPEKEPSQKAKSKKKSKSEPEKEPKHEPEKEPKHEPEKEPKHEPEKEPSVNSPQVGKVNVVNMGPSRRTSSNSNAHKKNDTKNKENIAKRKKYEADILNNDPVITDKEEIIDDEVESRVVFLTQRIISIRKIIEKIIKRCNATDFEVTNDTAFTWVIYIIQTCNIEEFNNHLRENINVTPDEYKQLSKLALNYYDLCNRIYEVDIND